MSNNASDFYKSRDYVIVNTPFGKLIAACAKFKYKGYEITMSTNSILNSACHTEVRIYNGENFDVLVNSECRTVEDAITYIDNYTNTRQLNDQTVLQAYNSLTRKYAEKYEEYFNLMQIKKLQPNNQDIELIKQDFHKEILQLFK